MRLSLLMAAISVLALGTLIDAEDRKCPYEAIVEAEDGEFVRSGPGPKYYPTDKLRMGERVIVQRHDPGGWCKIAPPEGSFSWIRAEHVHRSGENHGVLKSNGVVVHIGSALNPDEFTTVQESLSKGQAVEILGEKAFPFEEGTRQMFKISPIKRESRWIARKSIVAADAARSEPFPVEQRSPKKRKEPIANGESEPFAKSVSTGPGFDDDRLRASDTSRTAHDDQAVRQTGPEHDQQSASRKKLDQIDQHFREMIKHDPPTWDLESLENQYTELEEEVAQPSMTATVALRLDAVKRYRKIHQDYVEFFKLTSDTKQRDAQLMALQSQSESKLSSMNGASSATPISNLPQQIGLVPQPMPQPAAQPTTPRTPQPAAAPAFDGAGIVQKLAKTFPGGPQYILVAPDGRMLSFLQPAPGVDLSRSIGHSMGILGQRTRRNDWNADVITVRGMQPVQLRGSR